MKKELYIIGAGSVGGHIAVNISEYTDEFIIKGFFDDDPKKIGSKIFGYNVLGAIDDVLELEKASIIIGLAFPKVKRKILHKFSQKRSFHYPSFVHPNAWISESVEMGKGCIIYPGSSINYGSILGNFIVMNMNCALGHHTLIGDYTSLAPGVNTGGHTKISDCVDIGIGASTLQNVQIGENSIIGGQAMITHEIPANCTAVGVPAKPIKFHELNGAL